MAQNIHHDRILILDFGSQYAQLIARRVREIGVYCELRHFEITDSELDEFNPTGIILSGGPETVTHDTTPRIPAHIFNKGCPVLGICYGMQAMVTQLGGEVEKAQKHEYGHAELTVIGDPHLFHDIADHQMEAGQNVLDVWMSHGDKVASLPEGFVTIGQSTNSPHAAIACPEKHFYGVQFHPEVTHTLQGIRILDRFVRDICQATTLWTPSNILQDAIAHAREVVGDQDVLLGLSGGVDSSVVAALLHQAIGDQLHCVFIDNGLLRLHEVEQVNATFAKHLGIDLITVPGKDRFFEALKGVADPEDKRKVIGRVFVELFQEQAQHLPKVKWLAQGTIYPDVIESAASQTGKQTHLIKSHHNVGGLPESLHLKLLEPLRELFKDEVRKLGLELGLPADLINRHPFPGPGFAVRILGEIQEEFAEILRLADDIFIQSLREFDLYNKVSQAFTVFLPVKSVGVVGDARQYEYVVALRAVETIDFMTARWAALPTEFLAHVSNRIINEIPRISRVVYDISSKPPATIEWE